MASKYDRRNERARAAGWSGYGQQRKARELGYRTPAEYAAALRSAKATKQRVEPNPFQMVRRLAGGVDVRRLGGRTLIGGPWGSVERIGREVLRFADKRRATIYVDGKVWGVRGYTIGYLRELRRELGSFREVLLCILGQLTASRSDGPETEGAEFVSVEVV